MRTYHYIMQYVWLITSTGIIIASTYMGFQDGFNRWWMMYLFTVLTFIQYFRHRIQYRKLTNILEKNNQEIND